MSLQSPHVSSLRKTCLEVNAGLSAGPPYLSASAPSRIRPAKSWLLGIVVEQLDASYDVSRIKPPSNAKDSVDGIWHNQVQGYQALGIVVCNSGILGNFSAQAFKLQACLNTW